MKTFQLSIRTPLKETLTVDAHELHIDTETGRMVVLPGHTSLVGSVLFSRAKVKYENKEKEYYVKNGILYVGRNQNIVDLLVLSADEVSEIEITTVKDYLKFVREKLEKKQSLSGYQLSFLKREKFALEKQIEVVGK